MLIELHDVVYRYDAVLSEQPRAVLDGVSLNIAEGSVVALLGSSGSGRSTLLSLLNGLLKPAEGRVLVDGVDPSARGTNTALLRRQVGLLLQNPDDQLFGATVSADVAFGPRQLDVPASEIDERVRAALHAVGLSVTEFGSRSPFSLSGGQRRRVAIAGILAMRPRVLALDDPLAGLDPEGKIHLLQLLTTLGRREALTIIMATKDVSAALSISDHFIVLHDGRVAFDGDRTTFIDALPELEHIGLELPAQSRVLLALRARGWAVPPLADDVETAASLIAAAARSAESAG